jgi:transposase
MSGRYFVGIDLGSSEHVACITDEEGRVVKEARIEHSGEGMRQFVADLVLLARGSPKDLCVALETPRSSLVDGLLERDFSVFSINPKQLDRFRDRHTVAGAKDDRRDAFVLAISLRTDESLFRRLAPEDPYVVRLRELLRLHEDVVHEHLATVSRLRGQLHRYFPQALELSDGDEPWLWDLLEKAPTPGKARRLSMRWLDKKLRESRIKRIDGRAAKAALQRPCVPVAPGVLEAASEHVGYLVERLHMTHEQRSRSLKRIEELLVEMDAEEEGPARVAILQSMPGVGPLVAATLISEGTEALGQRDYQTLRTRAGVAPVTKQSGKMRHVSMRRACNPRLRNACYHMARVAMYRDEKCKKLYRALRERGHTHGHALRSLSDRMLRILVALLKTGEIYDPVHV